MKSDAGVAGMGAKALRILRSMGNGPVLYLCDDDAEAEALSAVLEGLMADVTVVHLPASDTLPGDPAPASPANVGLRVAALRRLRQLAGDRGRDELIVVTTGEAAARRYLPPEAFDAHPPSIRVGDRIDPDAFRHNAASLGYFPDDRIDEPGEIAVRGEVIDLYPADAGGPVRIGMEDGRVTEIHYFDAVTQLRGEACDTIEIGRAAEPEGDASATLLDQIAPGTLLLSPRAEKRRVRFTQLAKRAAKDAKASVDAIDDARWQDAVKGWRNEPGEDEGDLQGIPRFAEAKSPARAAQRFLEAESKAGRAIVIAGSARDLRFLRWRWGDTFSIAENCKSLRDQAAGDGGPIALLSAPLDRGARDGHLVLVAAADILGTRAMLGSDPSAARQVGLVGVDIRPGDLVIHEDHGFASVIGLEPAPGDDGGEVIALEYANEARRLVPVKDAGLLWRYGGDAESVRRDKLDGTGWDKRRAEIDKAIAQTATSLITLAEERAKLSAPAMEPDAAAYERFVSGFPYNETSDQAAAIAAVRDDLGSGRPMERLVIGDVGYGKTEVALRAAAIVALAGHQVIVAAPTTVLARQHLEEFTRRFADTGLTVAGLSRLTSVADRKAVLAGLADGSIGVVVGTAAVTGKSVKYAKLGLVVIDEEQRFGAADKAKLRRAADVHLLVMSATPIPRTLHRAMIGLQKVSVIATPPARRQPIRTIISDIDDPAIGLALRREKMRKGQSFVVVPRIADLVEIRKRLEHLAPDLSLVEVHGKMPGAELDEAMVGFASGEGDILLATNIIETGLDVPRANTMIICRSDRFGLAHLHQLRGRVGRGRRRGQVILTTQNETVSQATQKRLRTLETYDQLGSGFSIAGADLDQRGGGDILSDAQAGHMKLIGVELYQHLLEGALRRARGEAEREWYPEIRTGTVGAFPADWIPEEGVRFNLYIRLARLRDRGELETFEAELVDRFGPLPDVAQTLLDHALLTILALETGIRRVNAGPKAIALTPVKADDMALTAAGLIVSDERWVYTPDKSIAEPARTAIAILETLANQ